MKLYNAHGLVVQDDFAENMSLSYGYDPNGETNYTVIRVFQTKKDGTKQYPFIRYPGFASAEMLGRQEGWSLILNAGLGWNADIDGVAIENGVILNEGPATYHTDAFPLIIDENGTLSSGLVADTGTSILAQGGIVSATCGFGALIVDYEQTNVFSSFVTEPAQRSIIGQFGNGDYAIICSSGRNLDNSKGWLMAEAQAVCMELGLKFAYNLDGGGSSSLYIKKHPVYDNTQGSYRITPSFIVFNGTDTFSIPPVN